MPLVTALAVVLAFTGAPAHVGRGSARQPRPAPTTDRPVVIPATTFHARGGRCPAKAIAVRAALRRGTGHQSAVRISQIICATSRPRGPLLVGATWRLANERDVRRWLVARLDGSRLRALRSGTAASAAGGEDVRVFVQAGQGGLELVRRTTLAGSACTTTRTTLFRWSRGRLVAGRPVASKPCGDPPTPSDPPATAAPAASESPASAGPKSPLQAVVVGDPQLGAPLRCDAVRGGVAVRFASFQWFGRDADKQQLDGSFPVKPRDRVLDNGDGPTLDLTSGLLGMFIRCDVRAGGETASSRMLMAPPASTGAQIKGYAIESEYLTCDGGLYGVGQDREGHALRRTIFFRDGVPVYDRQANDVAVLGTYRLTAADIGHQITCRETGFNAGGFGAAPLSAPVTPTACSSNAPPFCLPIDLRDPWLTTSPFPDAPPPCSGCSPVRSSWSRLVANSKIFTPGYVRTSAYKTGRASAHVHVEVRTALSEPANVRVGLRSCRTMGTQYCDEYTTGEADGAYQVVARPAGPWVADYHYDVHDVAGGDISAILWQVGWLDTWVQTFAADVRFKCASWCGDDFVPIDAP